MKKEDEICRKSLNFLVNSECVMEEWNPQDQQYVYTINGNDTTKYTYEIPKVNIANDSDASAAMQLYMLIYVLSQHVLGRDPQKINSRIAQLAAFARQPAIPLQTRQARQELTGKTSAAPRSQQSPAGTPARHLVLPTQPARNSNFPLLKGMDANLSPRLRRGVGSRTVVNNDLNQPSILGPTHTLHPRAGPPLGADLGLETVGHEHRVADGQPNAPGADLNLRNRLSHRPRTKTYGNPSSIITSVQTNESNRTARHALRDHVPDNAGPRQNPVQSQMAAEQPAHPIPKTERRNAWKPEEQRSAPIQQNGLPGSPRGQPDSQISMQKWAANRSTKQNVNSSGQDVVDDAPNGALRGKRGQWSSEINQQNNKITNVIRVRPRQPGQPVALPPSMTALAITPALKSQDYSRFRGNPVPAKAELVRQEPEAEEPEAEKPEAVYPASQLQRQRNLAWQKKAQPLAVSRRAARPKVDELVSQQPVSQEPDTLFKKRQKVITSPKESTTPRTALQRSSSFSNSQTPQRTALQRSFSNTMNDR